MEKRNFISPPRHYIGPNHQHPVGLRDHTAAPAVVSKKDAYELGGVAKELKQENTTNNSLGIGIIAAVIGAFALYSIFYRG